MYEDATVYRLKMNVDYAVERLLGSFKDAEFKPCSKHQESSCGFVPVKKGSYLAANKNRALFRAKLERKVLSPDVFRQRVIEAVEDHKDLTGERLTKQQIKQLKAEIKQGLLPRAPKITQVIEAYIDTDKGCLVVKSLDKKINKLFLQLFNRTVDNAIDFTVAA